MPLKGKFKFKGEIWIQGEKENNELKMITLSNLKYCYVIYKTCIWANEFWLHVFGNPPHTCSEEKWAVGSWRALLGCERLVLGEVLACMRAATPVGAVKGQWRSVPPSRCVMRSCGCDGQPGALGPMLYRTHEECWASNLKCFCHTHHCCEVTLCADHSQYKCVSHHHIIHLKDVQFYSRYKSQLAQKDQCDNFIRG